jgi:hypothetical protein
MNIRLLRAGFLLWLAGTLALRLFGQHILRPVGWKGTVTLFLLTFPVMAWLGRRLCTRLELSRSEQFIGAVSLIFPTLLLDSFSSAFFPFVFPNISSETAGVFGGWMLWCCAGVIIGVLASQSIDQEKAEQR